MKMLAQSPSDDYFEAVHHLASIQHQRGEASRSVKTIQNVLDKYYALPDTTYTQLLATQVLALIEFGNFGEAEIFAERALRVIGETPENIKLQAEVLRSYGNVAGFQGQHKQAVARWTKAIRSLSGETRLREDTPEQLHKTIGKAVKATNLKDKQLLAVLLANIGKAYTFYMGQCDLASVYLGYAAQLAQATGDVKTQVQVLDSMGEVHFQRGMLDEAYECWDKALPIAIDNELSMYENNIYEALGNYHIIKGNWSEAAGNINRFIKSIESGSVEAAPWMGYNNLGQCQALQCHWDEAAQNLSKAYKNSFKSGITYIEAEAGARLAELRVETNKLDDVESLANRVLAILDEEPEPIIKAIIQRALGLYYTIQTDYTKADEAFAISLNAATQTPQEIALTKFAQSRSMRQRGKIGRADDLLEEAKKIAQDKGLAGILQFIDKRQTYIEGSFDNA